ncbi:PRTRC system protein C [Acidovorax delafieldii]|jgi:PRTRC genetic system protein C|uniref:PRTRC system protein C n=1 Tax=Acidovorax delafieldii TaxID=47920 RepID=UPI003ED0CF78
MSTTIAKINVVREFKYNGLTLKDPSPTMAIQKVQSFYSRQYPELNNAVVEGPVTSKGKAVYTFRKSAGAKG